jgi:hypothetical protein
LVYHTSDIETSRCSTLGSTADTAISENETRGRVKKRGELESKREQKRGQTSEV